MNAVINPPSRPIDVRVAASPVVGLRFHLDTRIADLDEITAEIERRLLQAAAHRATVLAHLRRNEDVRQHALGHLEMLLSHQDSADVTRCFADGLSLTAELGSTEERMGGLRRRLQDIAVERGLLSQASAQLREISSHGDVELNVKASRYSQAARQIYHIVADEHAAMARAILDGPMQRLTDAAFEAELVGRTLPGQPRAAQEAAKRCRQAASEAATGLARQIDSLDPLDVHHGLVPALSDLVKGRQPPQVARLRVLGKVRRLERLPELTLYRVVEESVENAIHHGRATRVDVVVSFHPTRVSIVVKDDGDGFDVNATRARLGRTRALGLIEMRERVRLGGGRLEVRSIVGMGTEVRVSVTEPA